MLTCCPWCLTVIGGDSARSQTLCSRRALPSPEREPGERGRVLQVWPGRKLLLFFFQK